jgi:DNA-directed RNA polymerase III subunit RPC1
MWSSDESYINLKVDHDTIGKLQLDVDIRDIINAIVKQKKLKIERHDIRFFKDIIEIRLHQVLTPKSAKTKIKDGAELFQRLQAVQRALPNITIRGYPEASRAVIKTDDLNQNTLLVEGYGLRSCMTTEGVDGLKTRTNSVMEMREVLGIEAARKTIIDEIQVVMGDMDIDPRHMQLLADVMTYKGEVLGITRFGLSKMRDSVLQLASFEKTPDHLFEAAWRMKRDKIEGVSECIIMGQSMSIGTGAFKVVRKLNLSEQDLQRKETVFEDCCKTLKKPFGYRKIM